jgi:hypothetical protein
MTSDKDSFLTLRKERDGSISFGKDVSTRIIGRGMVIIGNKETKEEKVLLVEDMKHNLLSVSQICDHGHKCWLRSLIIFLIQRSFVFNHVYTPCSIYTLEVCTLFHTGECRGGFTPLRGLGASELSTGVWGRSP